MHASSKKQKNLSVTKKTRNIYLQEMKANNHEHARIFCICKMSISIPYIPQKSWPSFPLNQIQYD